MTNNIKNIIYKLKDKKRYKKFKNCSLPYPFYDKKRNIFEWVKYSKTNDYETSNNLLDAFSNTNTLGITYHYKAKFYNYEKKKYEYNISHCHSFDELLCELYRYPESFEIPEEYIDEYSIQELNYIKSMKNYFKLIDLKDETYNKELKELDDTFERIDKKERKTIKDKIFLHYTYRRKWNNINEKDKLKRCNNKKVLEIESYHQIWTKNDKIASAIIDGQKNYRLHVKHSFSTSNLNEKLLVVNSNFEYVGIVKVVHEEYIKLNDLKEDMVNYKLAGFNSFKEYKECLYDEFKNECKSFNEEFTKDSLIIYDKLDVVEKFID